jgi:hypothetical protein
MTSAGKNTGARVLLVIGFLAASLSYSCWLAQRTVLDAGETRSLARALLETDAVQTNLSDQAIKQIDAEMPNGRGNAQVHTAVTEALHDPRVINAFADALGAIQGALVGKHQDQVTINGHALSAAIHDTLAAHNPQLAGELAKQAPLDIELNGNDLPRFGNTLNTARSVTTAAGLLAAFLICLSLFKAHDRHAVSRLGRRIAYMAIVPLLFFVVLPRVLAGLHGAGPEIVGTALRIYAGRVLPSPIVLVVVGLSVAIGALVVPAPRPTEAETRPATEVLPAQREPEKQPLYM